MDLTLITGVAGALKTAIDLGKGALEIRDTTKLQSIVIAMNDQLLNAQQSLFTHNAELLALQQQYFEATQKLREAEETLAERGSYSLFELVPGNFAYRLHIPPEASAPGAELTSEPMHYVCQQCFDGPGKLKRVLKFTPKGSGTYGHWTCPGCGSRIVDRANGAGPRPRRIIKRGGWMA